MERDKLVNFKIDEVKKRRVIKNYANTIIYCIKHKNDYNNENVCVGSTTNFLKRRNKYKTDTNNPNSKSYNQKKHKYIRENGGWDDFIMYEIEKFPCADKREAEARERYWYDTMNATLNSYRPYRSKEEKKQIERDYKKYRYQNDEEYRNRNIEQIKYRYQNNEEYRNRQIELKKNRYRNDPEFRNRIIERAKKKYRMMKNNI
tara:strand:+ start:540 stop:1148 length:609 start_codon:yes stop_codon:yes gene_type:complete